MEKILEFKACKALLKMVGECTDFKGRTAREEYWWAVLGLFIVLVAVGVVVGIIQFVTPAFLDKILNLILGIIELAGSFLAISMDVRRLHDVNKPWPWLLLALVPFGAFVLLYFCIQPSHPEANEYGPVPTSIV